jgi:hypothetical protein
MSTEIRSVLAHPTSNFSSGLKAVILLMQIQKDHSIQEVGESLNELHQLYNRL